MYPNLITSEGELERGWRQTGQVLFSTVTGGEMSRKEIGSKASNGVTSFIAKRVLVLPARKRIPLAVWFLNRGGKKENK